MYRCLWSMYKNMWKNSYSSLKTSPKIQLFLNYRKITLRTEYISLWSIINAYILKTILIHQSPNLIGSWFLTYLRIFSNSKPIVEAASPLAQNFSPLKLLSQPLNFLTNFPFNILIISEKYIFRRNTHAMWICSWTKYSFSFCTLLCALIQRR